MEAGKIDAVAAWDQDRVNRMMDDFQRYKRLFVERGILLATSNNGDIDLSTPSGVLTATIKTAVSEHEIAMMKVRQRRAARQRAEQGIPKWNKAFGYDDDRQAVPDEAELVRGAYEAILAGGSLSGIAREWNAKGHVGRTGKPWTASTISLFLRAPRNAGLRSHNNVIVGPGNWPALVDENTWRAAQAVLTDDSRKPGPRTCKRHFLTGLLRCGKCGATLSGYVVPRTEVLRYRCPKCFGVAISKPDTDDLIRQIVSARLAREDAKELLIDRDTPDLDALGAEANAIRTRRDELAAELADDTLTPSEWRAIRERLTARLDEIESRMTDAVQARVFDGIPLGSERVFDIVKGMDVDRQRAIVSALLYATVQPVGKRGRVPFDPERVIVEWRR